ncbi:hypothetical protein [Parageobacillus thermoglucosidasius]|uniref:hypothetical protein n=1 Tax=Parageobacillus thermoglucosidasius TaxID=1426 RepID=UPI001628D9FD|nr:hypothetical protein [Parageobacillus thermoglucosidasius]MED4904095.1 hypothetical protein [Parageobacillus thermoglucosidasius]MED4915645.1 hypothetical protein [Parageobacillus thermoglucosidasius]MED4945090.1 hypothetical protein [Parageobacillus thermoglucosidasius]MED4983713.1 hypothetical protein [Parageobacillus thermoglucosidasius]
MMKWEIKVLLPRWIWEEAKDIEHFKQLVLTYMQRYPEYIVRSVKGRFAVCERRE